MGQSNSSREHGSNSQARRTWADVARDALETSREQLSIGSGGSSRSPGPSPAVRGAQRRQSQMHYMPSIQKAKRVMNLITLDVQSLKLVPLGQGGDRFALTFQYSARCSGRLYLYFVATEESGVMSHTLRYKEMNLLQGKQSAVVCTIRPGENQTFGPANISGQEGFVLDTKHYSGDQLLYHKGSATYPVIVVLEANTTEYVAQHPDQADDSIANCQSTHLAVSRSMEKDSEDLTVTVLKQTISFNGSAYVVQKLFGVSSSSAESKDSSSSSTTEVTSGGAFGAQEDPDGNNCVICLDEPRNTTILPCLHMCLCYECATELRKTSANCPLCREEVREFWCIKGV